MGVVKKLIDSATDFVLFVAACAFTLHGFASNALIQNALDSFVISKGNVVVADAWPDTSVSGGEVIALLLLPEGVQSVVIDGIVIESDVGRGIMYINPEYTYSVSRDFAAEGVKLFISRK